MVSDSDEDILESFFPKEDSDDDAALAPLLSAGMGMGKKKARACALQHLRPNLLLLALGGAAASCLYEPDANGHVVVPNGTTSIVAWAYHVEGTCSCTSMVSIALPDGLTSIGNSAFAGCEFLASVALPDSLTSIGAGAFNSCSSLVSVALPDGHTSIGNDAFKSCDSLGLVYVPVGCSVSDDAFDNTAGGFVFGRGPPPPPPTPPPPPPVLGEATDSNTGISYVITATAECIQTGDSPACLQNPGIMQACEELGYTSLLTADDCLTGAIAFTSDAHYSDESDRLKGGGAGRAGGCQTHQSKIDGTAPEMTITGPTLEFFETGTSSCGALNYRCVCQVPPPSPPLSPPPPRTSTVGDDPLFIGGDGVAYEVRGEDGVVFSLVSTEHLSINSRIAAVPHRFRAADITETALGDVGVALCEGGRLTAFTLAADGRLTFVANGGASYAMEHERLTCDLSTMRCNTCQPVSDTPLQLPLFDGGHSRVKLHTAVADIVITRNAMIDLGSNFPIECNDFVRWPATHAACKTLLRGEPLANASAITHLLTGPTLQPEHRWHFMQIDLPRLELEQADVHGLLGHRALLSAPTSPTVRVGVGANGAAAPTAFGPQGKGAIDGHYTDYKRPRLHEHGSLRFGRFVCGSRCNASSCAVPDLISTIV